MRLAIIPARSGSKGLKDKNIKLLCGKPLVAYTIEAALKSNMFDTVMVSTDSNQYAEISMEYGAEVPFMRSQSTSGDTAGSWDVVKEVLDNYKNQSRYYSDVCLLQPTSPLRNEKDIINAYRLFDDKGAKAVISVCELEHPLSWCNTLDSSLSLDGFISREKDTRRQLQQKYYRLNGAIYIVKTEELYVDDFLYREGCFAYIMDLKNSIDIDNADDFKLAEFWVRNE